MGRASRLLVVNLSALAAGAPPADVRKVVVNTAWWPPGTEKKSESVGIISHGFVFMTAMMEMNATVLETAEAELSDVRDIAVAAGAGLEDLVDCLLNAPKGGAAVVRQALTRALRSQLPPATVLPALTVVEVPGEYSFFNTSVYCVAALPGADRTAVHSDRSYGVCSRGLLHLEAFGTAQSVVPEVAKLVVKAGGAGLQDVAECTAFLQDLKRDSAPLRVAFGSFLEEGQKGPVLTLVQAGLEPGKAVALRCVAAVPLGTGDSMRRGEPVVAHPGPGIAATRRLAFIEGQFSTKTNGTDGFASLAQVLSYANVSLADVVTCLFFVKDQAKVYDLFDGFYEVFNVQNFPPPSRNELQAVMECTDCEVLMRCMAALPLAGVPDLAAAAPWQVLV